MGPENLLLLALLVGLLLLMFSRTRKQQREAQQIQSELAPGVEVMTTSGLFATVVELDDATVVLETGPGQRSRWDRRAVARVMPPDGEATEDDAAAGDEGAGARLEHDSEDDGEGPSPSGPATAPPDRG